MEALASVTRPPQDLLVLRPSLRGAVFTGLLLSSISGGAAAQSANGNPPGPGVHTHSPVAAGLIEWLIPTAGFAYGGDWTRGFLPNALPYLVQRREHEQPVFRFLHEFPQGFEFNPDNRGFNGNNGQVEAPCIVVLRIFSQRIRREDDKPD